MLRSTHVVILLSVFLVSAATAQTPPPQPSGGIWVLVNDLPGADREVGKSLLTHIAERGDIDARVCTSVELLHVLRPEWTRNDTLLVLTDCGILPVEAAKPLDSFLERGGAVIALGGTLFRKPVMMKSEVSFPYQNVEWVTREEYEEGISKVSMDHLVFDFAKQSSAEWTRASNDLSHPSTYEFGNAPGRGGYLHMQIENMTGWETVASPPLASPIPEGNTFTCFWAKGGPRTNRLLVEWQEKDGSRWLATVPLTTEWKRYVVPETDFKFWESVPARAETKLNLANAQRFSCGLAHSHTPGLGGDHEIWIGEVGTISGDRIHTKDWTIDFKRRHLLYPGYHVYSCTDFSSIEVCPSQAVAPSRVSFPMPEEVRAFHPRPQGTGYEKSRDYRWIPLLEAVSRQGDHRGTIAALRFNRTLDRMWAGMAIEDPDYYKDDEVLDFVSDLAKRMAEGGFLWEGGTTQYTYLPGQEVRFGFSPTVGDRPFPPGTSIEYSITESESGRIVFKGTSNDVLPNLSEVWSPKQNLPYRVTVDLLVDGILADRLEHPLQVWEPDPNIEWIKTDKGYFSLDGKPWYAYGVNYMPSSGIARESWKPFEYWLGSDAYDPQIVERDLSRIADMGLNMVSVFLYHDSLKSWNLLDLLRRCENHRLRVNLSLRPGTPMDFPWEQVKEMIEANRLAENRTVFAYDLAWEPHFGGEDSRAQYGKEWNQWIRAKYDTPEKAFEVWSYTPEGSEGIVPIPPSRHWFSSGEWNGMLADYSQFLQDLIAGPYKEARDKVREIDPNHLVSFRMTNAGDPTYWGPSWIYYDLRGLVDSVDIMEPEAYGRIGDWNRVRPGRFTVDYCRAIAPDLPVFWAEMGKSAWNQPLMESSQSHLEGVADYYRDFLRMVLESHSDGIAFWWYPGGYRTGEKSDYGIINPDGTDRPVTRVIREIAPRVKGQGERPEPDTILPIDRSWKPGGLSGLYDEVKEQYWKAIESGNNVALSIE